LGSAALFNAFLVAVLWSAIGILALAVALALLLVAVRIRANAKQQRTRLTVERWREIFLERSPKPLDPPLRADAFTVLQLWNDFVRTDREGRMQRLRQLAGDCGLDESCGTLLRGHRGARVVGLTFAGSMRTTAHLDLVRALREDPIGEVSLAAARAAVLCGIESTEDFLRATTEHHNWRVRNVEEILVEIGYFGPTRDPNRAETDRRVVPRRAVGVLRTET
jgi:hypothetical protein